MSEPTRQQITGEFDRIEKDGGGAALTNSGEVIRQVAATLGIDPERVRSVMLDHWDTRASG